MQKLDIFAFCVMFFVMSIQQIVESRVSRMKSGRLVTYSDFKDESRTSPQALAKAFQRLVDRGELERHSKGVFYKPKQTRFGKLRPSDSEVLRNLMTADGKFHGYVSGQDVFRLFQMSTQIPSTKTIAIDSAKRRTSLTSFNVRFVQSYVSSFAKEDIVKLQLLDALRFIKKAMDTNPDVIVSKFIEIISNWSERDVRQLVRFGLKYPPSTRALLGAISEQVGYDKYVDIIRGSLNPSTSYTIGLSSGVLPLKANWRIK